MKALKLFLLIVLFFAVTPLIAQSAFTATYTGKAILITGEAGIPSAKVFQVKGKIDTAKSGGVEIISLTSDDLNVAYWNDTTTTAYLEGYLTSSTTVHSKRKVGVKIYGATLKEGPYILIQTIAPAPDSISITDSRIKAQFFHGLTYKFPWIRMQPYKNTGNTVTNFDIRLVFLRNKFFNF